MEILSSLTWMIVVGLWAGFFVFLFWIIGTLKGIRRDIQTVAERIHDLQSSLRATQPRG